MTIYMLSLAVLTECHGLPTSYYLKPSAETGATARYVLVYGCSVKPLGAVMVQQLNDGCTWERGAK